MKLADHLSGHLPPLPSGREESGQTRPESPGPTVCLPVRGPSEVALPPLGCAGAGGQQGPAAHLPAATSLRTSSPQEAPHRRQSPSENKRPAPWGLTIRPRPAMKKGVRASSAAAPPPLKTAPSHRHLRPPPNTVWESQAAAGARAAGGGDLPPPPPAWNPGASHSHARDKRLNTDPEAQPWGPPISPARGRLT